MNKILVTLLTINLVCGWAFVSSSHAQETHEKLLVTKNIMGKESKKLRHVVLFEFNDNASREDIHKVEEAFSALPGKISEIKGYEWGTNNSPEGLNDGLTHCFVVTFESEEDRAVYLPHPAHKAFVEVLKPHLKKAVVVDYWAHEE